VYIRKSNDDEDQAYLFIDAKSFKNMNNEEDLSWV
jgi:hypothetical protein